MQGYVNNLKAGLSHSHALNVSCVTGTVVCPLPPLKARHHRCGQEDAQGVYFGFVHGISMARASPGALSPAFHLAWICLISPAPLPATACLQHGLTLQALLSIQPNQSTSRLPQHLWSSWIQVSDPSPLGKLCLAISTCSHAHVWPPSCGALATAPTAVMFNLLRSTRTLSKDLLSTWDKL